MQNEFDDHIKKQVDEFKLSPSPQVWDLVEAQLPEKKRRRFIFWWLPLLLVLAGITVYKFIGNKGDNKEITINKVIAKINKIDKKDTIDNLQKSNKIINKATVADLNNRKLISKKIEKKYLKSNRNNIDDNNRLNVYSNAKSKINKSKSKEESNENKESYNSSYSNQLNIIKKETIADKKNSDSQIVIKKIDSIISNDLVKTDNKKENDTGKLDYKKITPKLNPNKTNWEVVAFVGASNTVEKALTSNNNSSLYDQPSNLSTSNPGGFTQVNLLAPTARISFGFNLKRIQSISKKMAWYGSFGYKYLSNHQASGAFVDSSKIIGFDSLALLVSTAKTDRVPSYFKYGNTLNHNNYAHLLNVSAGLKYNVSKAFSLNGGIAIGYQIKSKWLQPDTKQSILYYSNKLTNKWNIGATIGIDYKLRKFSIGVFYNYDFTKTSLSNTPQNVHWQNFGATISVPLSFHK